MIITISNPDFYLDQKALEAFRANPPAFLQVSAKRKTK